MRNPFVTNGYVSAEYFCDRVEETKKIISLLTNGNNIALISPRRIGKTDLIRHCFNQKEICENYHTFLIDIYATNSLEEFVNAFGKAIIDELKPKGKSIWEGFVNVLASLRPEISFDINGQPSWGVSLGSITNPTTTLDEIFKYLQNAGKPCLIAIDEFQQITKYNNSKSVEALLRTHIQRCSNANFIFSGSQRHMMDSIFTSPNRPFYQSVSLFNLQPIPMEKYEEFCSHHFESCGKHLSEGVVPYLYRKFQNTTAYMQKIMNFLYKETDKGETCSIEMIDTAIADIINLSTDTYDNLLYQIPDKQKKILIAIAKDEKAKAVCSSDFVKKHNLSSASSVSSAIKGLLEKDLITHNKDEYYLNDIFLQLYLSQNW